MWRSKTGSVRRAWTGPPTAWRTVAKSDADSLRKNFADIAAGKVRVTE